MDRERNNEQVCDECEEEREDQLVFVELDNSIFYCDALLCRACLAKKSDPAVLVSSDPWAQYRWKKEK